MSKYKIELNTQVKDSITGFKGLVTARAEYITGCRQYCVTAKADKNKMGDVLWFDEDRLLETPSKRKNLGGPQSTPPSKHHR